MGDPVCWLSSVCLSCGRFLEDVGEPDRPCPHCGKPVDGVSSPGREGTEGA